MDHLLNKQYESKKANVIEAKGTIFKESGNGYFNVELEEPAGHQCLCRASGKLITRKIQLLVGDRVTVELSPYDLDRGRITLREINDITRPSNCF